MWCHDRSMGEFVGRTRELTALAAHLGCARAGRPQVVVVEGEPGTGKTALVQTFLAGLDADVTVLQAGGEEIEELVPYGVVEQIALGAGEPGDAVVARAADEPPTVGAALVALLGRLRSRGGPVVLAVDDAHWADVRSVQALVFALRRLGTAPVLTMVASRPRDGGRIERLRVLATGERGARLRLGGLDVDELVALGRALGKGALPVPAAQRLRDHTGGVPLHARALFDEVDTAVLRSVQVPLPSPMSYAVLVMGRLSQCPPATREVVAAAAVLGEPCRLQDALDLAGVSGVDEVAPAVAARLLTTGPGPDGARLRFPHALIRAAVYHDLDLATRSALHIRAAGIVATTEEALRHRLAASTGSDPLLAVELDRLAAGQVARGELARAASSLVSAAGLHPDPADRRRCVLDAVELLVRTGERARAEELLAGLPPAPGAVAAGESHVRGQLAFAAGRMAEAEHLLLEAWASAADTETALRTKICERLCHLYYLQLRPDDAVEWGNRAALAAPWSSGLLVTSLALAGRPDTRPLRGAGSDDPAAAVARGAQLLWTEDLAGARAELTTAVTALRRSGMFMASLHAQGYLALAEHRMGAWEDAVAHTDEAVALAEDTEQDWTLARLHSYAAMPLAAQGEWELAEAHVAAAAAAAAATGLSLDRVGSTVAAANVADARGRHAVVVELLGPMAAQARSGVAGEPGVSNWPCLLADALIRLGRISDADEVLAPYERRATELGRNLARAAAGRVRGWLEAARGDLDAADRAFSEAACYARAGGSEIDGALVALAHGAVARRAGRRRDAATQLGAARAVLVRLGARPALARCDGELAACGLSPVRRTLPGGLTPRELAVARLAASGISNPEVAAELVVSVNTVEFHLRNVYAKLGIHSRAELAPHLADSDQ